MRKEETDIVDPHDKPFLTERLPSGVYVTAVRGIVLITFICVGGIIALTYEGKPSEGLISIASACIGGLVGIFSQRATNN